MTSRRSRASSACSGFICPWPGKACCESAAHSSTHRRNTVPCTPKSRAACATVTPRSWINRSGPIRLNGSLSFLSGRSAHPLQWTPPSRHECREFKRVTVYMQRNGAAPAFCFFLCFWASVFGLAELIHTPGSASTRCPVNLVRRHVIQRLVSSLRVVKYKVVRQSPL